MFGAGTNRTERVNLAYFLKHGVFKDYLVPHDTDPLYDLPEYRDTIEEDVLEKYYTNEEGSPKKCGSTCLPCYGPAAKTKDAGDYVPKVRPLGSRSWMHAEWTRTGNAPLPFLRKYYGERLAMYICWSETLHKRLVAPSILGLITFIYGMIHFNGKERDYNSTVQVSGFDYGVDQVFNNECTVVFTILLAGWCTYFLEIWKRIQITQVRHVFTGGTISELVGSTGRETHVP